MTVRALDDKHDTLLSGSLSSSKATEGTRDRYTYDRTEVLEQALEAWRVNPLARRIVALTSQYVVGAGIEVTSRHEQTSAFLHEWQEHRLNRLQTRAFEWCDELTRTGNLCVLLTTDQAGMSYLRAVPVYDVDDIETQPNDVEQPTRFIMKPVYGSTHVSTQESDATTYPAYNQDTDARNDDGTYPTVMLHYAINRPVGAKWGESDLAPLLMWLSRYANWLQDRARLNKYRQAFLYDVTGTFTSEADRLARQAELNANPPNAGSILVHNAAEIWQVLSPKLNSSDANTDGLALKKMIAAGAGVPLHFLAEPESSTRTTAEAAGGPTFRHYQQRQVFFLWLLRDLTRIVVRRRAMVDKHVSVKADLEAQAPDISGRDNAALAVAATQIASAFGALHDRGLLPDDELIRMIYSFAGETVDVNEILARAPGEPQTIQYGAPDPNVRADPSVGPAATGAGHPEPVEGRPHNPEAKKPEKPGAPSPSKGGTGPQEAKPYNLNPKSGEVSAKGAASLSGSAATMATQHPELVEGAELLKAWQAELVETWQAELVEARAELMTNPAPAPAITNTLTLDLTPIAAAIAEANQNTAAQIAEASQATAETLAKYGQTQVSALSDAIAESSQATAQAMATALTAVGSAVQAVADRESQPLPAPIVHVSPQISIPPAPPAHVDVTVQIPKTTKTVRRDRDGRIKSITEE